MGAWRCHSVGGSGSSAIDHGQATRRGDEEIEVGGGGLERVSNYGLWSMEDSESDMDGRIVVMESTRLTD